MVSVIIPTFNDIDVLPQIVDVVIQSNIVDEIIIVNDGSTSENTQKIHQIKDVKIIDQPVNMGKSMALKTGFLESKGDVVCFLDADLRGLRSVDVINLVTPIINNKYDMTLSQRGGFTSESFWRITGIGFGESLTGERAFQRKIIEDNMEIFDTKGFSIEVNMNKTFLRSYRVAVVVFPYAQNKLKFEKIGVRKGIPADIKMMKDILNTVGVKEFILQGLYVKKLDIIKPIGDQNKYKVMSIHKLRDQIVSEILKLKNKTLVMK